MEAADGQFVSLYHESDDLAEAFHVLGTSDSPYLQWFRKEVAEVHALSPEMLLGPPPRLSMDWRG